ncbi:NAD-dependent epimerase/dehydratase family protein [Hymenobacter nivis]|uniref:NAD-dependent epimerase/dehydratase family protein n=1 Tax=Hymenobacter nivis TaxID=1850093 RepID=A0A502HF25_9BACT|nr:NAD-dependent epimerase/dehydratase family protein [Hymenobacter nivis]TPG72262.1 NAD-dependent epimerase/dehydratase family protein [Hymenobacter nivis]
MSNSLTAVTTCVIGGTGFIGRAVVKELLAKGRQVVVVGRQLTPTPPLPKGVRYIQNAIDGSVIAFNQALVACDEVVDLAYATVPGTSFQDPVNDILVNLPEAVRLFEMASAMPLKKFVWISSGGTVYGRTSIDLIPETYPTLPLSPYGITKLAIEKYAHMYFESKGLPIVCVRPSNAFGEGQRTYSGQGFIATAIASVLDGRELLLFGEKGTIRDYLHVTDMAVGIVAALMHGQPGEVYNLGSGQGLSNRQVLDELVPLAAQAGYNMDVRVLPSRPFDVPVNVLDCTKLRTETGWQPQLTFVEALAQTWSWYTKQK